MAEPKPLASLSGSLLARKGAAKPAMRRQGIGGLTSLTSHHEDLGWNDMGYDVDPALGDEKVEHQRIDLTPMLTPIHHARDASNVGDVHNESHVVPEVVRQRETLARTFEAASPHELEANEAAAAMPAASLSEAIEGSAPEVPLLQVKPKAKAAVAKAAATRGRKPRAASRSKAKAAFTLRIDPERHLRLRLASALTRRSAQVILTDALDKYLKTLPEVDAFAHQLPNS